MRIAVGMMCFLFSGSLFAAEVRWNCFALHDLGETDSVGCYYYDDGYSSPEIGLRYVYDKTGLVHIDGKGTSNIGWNVALWVDSVAGDVLDRAYFSLPHTVLKDSYNKLVPNPIVLDSTGDVLDVERGDSFYLALIGNYYDDDGMPSDYFGWVEMENTGVELVIRNSAFSYGGIVVGGGAVPEPSSALLFLLGCAGLLLKRQQRKFER